MKNTKQKKWIHDMKSPIGALQSVLYGLNQEDAIDPELKKLLADSIAEIKKLVDELERSQ